MKTLALLLLLLAPLRAAASGGPSETRAAKKSPEVSDPAEDLRAAEKAISRGGGADAYAERGAAKRALGRPFEEYILDYAEAAKRDSRYHERLEGLIAQRESQTRSERKAREVTADHDPNALAKALFSVAVAILAVFALLVLFEGRERRV